MLPTSSPTFASRVSRFAPSHMLHNISPTSPTRSPPHPLAFSLKNSSQEHTLSLMHPTEKEVRDIGGMSILMTPGEMFAYKLSLWG
jgi:hypothetical protein